MLARRRPGEFFGCPPALRAPILGR